MTDYAAARTAMVDRQIRPADVTRRAIIAAMLWAPREQFVPRAKAAVAYADGPIKIAENRWLMEPRAFAKLLEAADIGPSDAALVVGCGRGYGAAVTARLAGAVVAVEEDSAMAAQAEETLSALGVDNAAVIVGPLTNGAPGEGPFDVILIEGAVETAPDALFDQLADGGRLATIWTGAGGTGSARVYVKSGDQVAARTVFDASAETLPGFHKTAEFAF